MTGSEVLSINLLHVGRTWRRLNRPIFGLANVISDQIAAKEWEVPGLLTNVRYGSEVLMASDYGGSHKASKYETFGFLVGSTSGAADWDRLRYKVRRSFASDNRRLAYKKLRSDRDIEWLIAFLDMANYFPGVIVTFLVDKSIKPMLGDYGSIRWFPEMVVAERGWNQRAFRKLSLVANMGGLLLAGLTDTSQDMLWVTDQDEIAPNPTKHNHAGHVIHHYISTFAPDKNGFITFATTELDIGERRHEDAVAIPDLVAGALADSMSRVRSEGIEAGSLLCVPLPESVPLKTRIVLRWLSAHYFPLRRLVVVLDKDEAGNVLSKVVRLTYQPSTLLYPHSALLRPTGSVILT